MDKRPESLRKDIRGKGACRHIAAALLWAALFLAPLAPAHAMLVDRIVAVVNGDIITLSELKAEEALAAKGLRNKKPEGAEFRSAILDILIEKLIVKQAADRTGVTVSEVEVDNAIADVKKQNNLTHDTLILALTQSGLTYEGYRAQMKEDIRQSKFVNSNFRAKTGVSDQDAADYYKQNHDEFAGQPSYRIRLIFIPADPPELAKARLETVIKELKAGMPFEKLAKEYSSGPAAAEGGDMGYLKKGEAAPLLEQTAGSLKEGEISAPIKTETGIYLIQLAGRKAAEPAPFDSVKELIRNKLHQKAFKERYDAWIKDMRGMAHIEVRL